MLRSCLTIALAVLAFAVGQAPAATPSSLVEPPGKPPVVPVVLRLSKEAIAGLTRKSFQRDTPIAETNGKTTVRGNAHTEGEPEIEFEPSPDRAAFLLKVRGVIQLQLVIEQTPVVVVGQGILEFTASKRVFFDGKHYRGEETTVEGSFCPRIDQVITPPGLRGLIYRVLAKRTIPRRTAGSVGERSAKSEREDQGSLR